MFVYGSGGWVPAGSSVNGTSQRYKYVATSGQTSFSGTDANGNTLTYDAGFIDVYLNGVHLDPTDYTATTGTSVVLGSGAALNDELYIVAFGTFNVASFNGSGLIDGTTNISKLNATGTRDGTTFLAGDNTFKTVAVTPTAVSDQANSSTGYFSLPAGTTAQRPVSPATGFIRQNTDFNALETYDGSNWVFVGDQSAVYPIDYLIVAGGAGSGRSSGATGANGGAGAGGYLSITSNIIVGTAYSITVGAGGNGQSGSIGRGSAGSNSTFNSLTVIGGGTGGVGAGGLENGVSGGSGGGGGGLGGTGGAGTSGQGNAGGAAPSYAGGGGGGAGAVGSAGVSNSPAGAGGVGLNWQSLGTFYAGGGGGACNDSSPGGAGGNGGGGAGAVDPTSQGTAGTANRGGGGGASGYNSQNGVNGGSGIVIIRYVGSQRASGGTVTSAGGYTYHTFTSSGTLTA
jgi:hypothetical protein